MFSGAERGRAFGAVVGISTAVGPVAGGLILALAGEADGWRWIFFSNLPIGLVALLLAARLIPRTEPGPRGHVDGVGAALPAAFVAWERRVVARDRAPLLDVRLLTHTAGYASGAALGTVYIIGFSGIWLVFALFFQTGLGYTPLASGLAVTPFALGSAASAPAGGRLVERMGRLLIVLGLGLVVAGLGATALVLLWAPPAAAGWAVAAPLLVAGVGGGWVIAPNTTLTLRCVPVRMAGSAGGALQSGQRIGSAIGTAALTGLFYAVLAATAADQRVAVATAIGAAAAWVGVALAIAVVEWRRDRRVAAGAGGPDPDAVRVPVQHHY